MVYLGSVRASLSTLLFVGLASSGCADPDPDSGMGPEPDPEDTTAPSIVSTVPAADATGVAANATITITFSEPMDRATVEAAYSSADLPLEGTSITWNDENTVMSIQPAAELEYAEGIGNDPSTVTARTYAVSFGAGAADYAGNTLAEPFTLTFATKRRLLTGAPMREDLTRVTAGQYLLPANTNISVGDDGDNLGYRSFVSFDLAEIPDGITVEAAEMSGRQLAPTGAPYNLGPANAYHLTFGSMAQAATAQAISLPGPLSQDATSESKRLDVTSQVIDDLANRAARGNLSQYRLQMDQTTDNDGAADTAVFARNTFTLLLIYVAD